VPLFTVTVLAIKSPPPAAEASESTASPLASASAVMFALLSVIIR
jgi:hypothetical protein